MPGVERKVLKEVDSNIPGYAKIRVRDVIFRPGSSTLMMTMENDTVCETTEGALEGTKVDRRLRRLKVRCGPAGKAARN
jgi:hypothetical protein